MVVYCVTCSVCGMQYLGQTENLRKQLNNHKSCIRNFDPRKDTLGYSADGTEVYKHFNLPGHDLTNMKVTIMEHVAESSGESKSTCVLRQLMLMTPRVPEL